MLRGPSKQLVSARNTIFSLNLNSLVSGRTNMETTILVLSPFVIINGFFNFAEWRKSVCGAGFIVIFKNEYNFI